MRRAGVPAVLAIGAMMLVACGGGSTPSAEPSPAETTSTPSTTVAQTTTPPPSNAVIIADNEFQPMQLDVSIGTTITWTQIGTATHTVTARDGSFDSRPRCPADISQCMKQGETFSRAFQTAGRFEYWCKVHTTLMAGTVIVT
jgi:plastocyanin